MKLIHLIMEINMWGTEGMESDSIYCNNYKVKIKVEKCVNLRRRRREFDVSILMVEDNASSPRQFCKKLTMTFGNLNTYLVKRYINNVAFQRPAEQLSCWTVSEETVTDCSEANVLTLVIMIEE